MAQPVVTQAEVMDQAVTVFKAHDEQVAAARALEKELKEFSGGLPYDQARVIERTQDGFRLGAQGFYQAGLGLILLERQEGVHTYGLILDQYFPGISRTAAFNYMRFSRAMSNHPAFKTFIYERGGYSKALTMLEACSEEEIGEFEETGQVRGFTQDEIDKMSVRQLKRALRLAKEKAAAAVKKATEKLGEENAELTKEVEALKAALTPSELAAAKKVFGRVAQKLGEAANLARKIDLKLLAGDWNTRLKCLAQLHHLEMMVGQMQGVILAAEEPEAPGGGSGQ